IRTVFNFPLFRPFFHLLLSPEIHLYNFSHILNCIITAIQVSFARNIGIFGQKTAIKENLQIQSWSSTHQQKSACSVLSAHSEDLVDVAQDMRRVDLRQIEISLFLPMHL